MNDKLLADVKNLTYENDTIEKKKSDMKIDLENTRKHLKDTSHLFEKKSEQMEAKIKDLKDFKEAKMSEEKELKGKQKKLERRKRILVEKEAKLKDENEKQEVNENYKPSAASKVIKEAIEDGENVVLNIPVRNMFDNLKKCSGDDSAVALDLASSSIDKTTTTSQVSLSLDTTSLFSTSTSPLTVLNPSSGASSSFGNKEDPAANPAPCSTDAKTRTAVVSPSASQSQFRNEILRRLYGRRN